MLILAADIGGSQARLLLGQCHNHGWKTLRQLVLASRDFTGIDALLRSFLLDGELPDVACIAVAGPIEGDRVQVTNLPWTLDANDIAAHFGIRQVRLINDFSAQAYGLPLMQPADLHTLQAGIPLAHGVRALIGAGTGLGMALLTECAGQPLVLPSEGGHAGFAPQDARQAALLQYLLPAHGHVSQELLLCGHGLERLYAFVTGLPVDARPPMDAPEIGAAALAGNVQAADAVNLFARLLASAAGNLALTGLARNGVYLSGGIAPKILPFLQQPIVREAFCNKPPMRALLERVPLYVVRNEQLGLLGAADLAARMAAQSRRNAD